MPHSKAISDSALLLSRNQTETNCLRNLNPSISNTVKGPEMMSNTKMRRRALFCILALCLAAGVFTGCRMTEEERFRFALDTKYAQIGCYWGYAEYLGEYESEERENRPCLRIGFPFWVDFGDSESAGRDGVDGGVNGLLLSLYDVSGGVNGVGVAPVCVGAKCNGLVLSPLLFFSGDLNGLSVAPANGCFDGNSVQIGIVNWRGAWGRIYSGQKDNGIAQIGVFNRALETNRFQIGVFNDSRREGDKVKSNPYLQFGLINLADNAKKEQSAAETEKSFSLQIGLWNYNGRWWGLPLVNATW